MVPHLAFHRRIQHLFLTRKRHLSPHVLLAVLFLNLLVDHPAGIQHLNLHLHLAFLFLHVLVVFDLDLDNFICDGVVVEHLKDVQDSAAKLSIRRVHVPHNVLKCRVGFGVPVFCNACLLFHCLLEGVDLALQLVDVSLSRVPCEILTPFAAVMRVEMI